jgi:hypothetical protein
MKPLFVLLAVGAASWIATDAFAQSGTLSNEGGDPQLNRREARSYDNLVDHDSGFRNQRMHKECGPIESEELRRQCMDSFSGSASNSSGSSGTMRR